MSNSQTRYRDEYLQTARTYLDHGVPPETAQEAALRARRRAYRLRVTEDAWVRNILLTMAVCGTCFALAVFLGRVPIAGWMVGK